MEIQKIASANTVTPTPNTSAAPPPRQRTNVDVLISVGKTGGWVLWVFTSFIVRKSFSLLASLIWRKEAVAASADLSAFVTEDNFRKTFEEAPFSVIMKIIDSIHDDPITAGKLVDMIAKDCKANPKIYSPYRGNPGECYKLRKTWIGEVDYIFIQCLLSPNLFSIESKASMGETDDAEGCVMRILDDGEWKKVEHTYPEKVREFRKLYKEVHNCKTQFNDLWVRLLSQLDVDLPHLDLMKDETYVNPIPKEGKTIGLFLERLLFKMGTSEFSNNKLTNLLVRDTFDSWADYTAEILRFVLREKSTAQINLFCSRLLAILDDKQKRTTLFNLSTTVIRVFHPENEQKTKKE